jgi:signal transduction histidine kinase
VLLAVLLAVAALGVAHVLLIDTFRRESPDSFRTLIILAEVVILGALVAGAARYLLSVARERTRNAVIESLAEVFSTPRSIEEIAQASVARLVGADVAASALLAVAKEDGRQLEPIAASGYPPHSGIQPRETAGILPSEAIARRQANLDDAWLAPVAARSGQQPWVARVPIVNDEEVLGLLLLISPTRGLLGDTRLLRTVATLIATALDHAQLYEAAYAPPPNAEDEALARHELLSAVASELRPAFVTVEAHASVIAGEETSPGTIEDARRLSVLTQSIERLNGMLEDLTSLGRGDDVAAESRQPDATASIDVARVARAAVAAFAPAFEARLQVVEVDLPDAPLTAVASADAVERLLLHLLSNANRSTPDEGQITVRAHDDGDVVRIEVEDAGPAVDPLERGHIFEPFYRVAAGLPEVPGAGLGLAVVHQFAQSQGGAVWAEPRPGGGTAYYVDLPTRARPAIEVEVAPLVATDLDAADEAEAVDIAEAEPEISELGTDEDAVEALPAEVDEAIALDELPEVLEEEAVLEAAEEVPEMAPADQEPDFEPGEPGVEAGIEERAPDIEPVDVDRSDFEATARRFEDEPTQPIEIQWSEESESVVAERLDMDADPEPPEGGTPALATDESSEHLPGWEPRSEFDTQAHEVIDHRNALDAAGGASEEAEQIEELADEHAPAPRDYRLEPDEVLALDDPDGDRREGDDEPRDTRP